MIFLSYNAIWTLKTKVEFKLTTQIMQIIIINKILGPKIYNKIRFASSQGTKSSLKSLISSLNVS